MRLADVSGSATGSGTTAVNDHGPKRQNADKHHERTIRQGATTEAMSRR